MSCAFALIRGTEVPDSLDSNARRGTGFTAARPITWTTSVVEVTIFLALTDS
jgi:hypothetical protein